MTSIVLSQPFLPPFEEFSGLLESVWDNKHLTNKGKLHNQLERELATYLNVEYLTLLSNGTLALMAAIESLVTEQPGEIITTPYTFVATAQAIRACGLRPVFADIDPETFNLDPRCVEPLISEKTKAIIPVHCYGNPCDVEAFEDLSRLHNIPIIYDAAHAFNVQLNGRSLLSYGDASILSLHATKVFHTFEGGVVVSKMAEEKEQVYRWQDFGYEAETIIEQPGLNAKMHEASAAMGLALLPYYQASEDRRSEIADLYRAGLHDLMGIELVETGTNYGYFPIRVKPSCRLGRDELHDQLWKSGIKVRRYFYPLVSDFKMFSNADRGCELTNAKMIASEVLCLPVHSNLTNNDVEYILSMLHEFCS